MNEQSDFAQRVAMGNQSSVDINWADPANTPGLSAAAGWSEVRGDGQIEVAIASRRPFPEPYNSAFAGFMTDGTSGAQIEWGSNAMFPLKTNIDAMQTLKMSDAADAKWSPDIQQHIHGNSADMNRFEWNYSFMDAYVQAAMNVEGTCDDLRAWKYFYYDYHTDIGKFHVDNYIRFAQPPDACVAALKLNYTPEVEQAYRILNDPDLSISPLDGSNALPDYKAYATQSGRYDGSARYYDDPSNVSTRDTCTTITSVGGPYQSGTSTSCVVNGAAGVATVPAPMLKTADSFYFFGDPTKTLAQRRQQLAEMMPVYPESGTAFLTAWANLFVPKVPPPEHNPSPTDTPPDSPIADRLKKEFGGNYKPGKASGITTPGYMGNLPYVPDPILPGMTPWTNGTPDTKHGGYKDPCKNQTMVEMLVTYGTAVVGVVLGSVLMPFGTPAKVVSTVTLGATGYLLGHGIVLGATASDLPNAALVFSVGVPTAVWLAATNIGIVPDNVLIVGGGVVVAAGLGFYVIDPVVRPLFDIGGSLLGIVGTVVDVLDKITESVFNGCANHEWATFLGACDADNSQSKPALQDLWLKDFYGTTGDQRSMRKQCLQTAMTNPTGAWGKDPVVIGEVDFENGTMTNPAACIPGEYWPYLRPLKDPLSAEMWGEVSPCFDPAHRCFQPPTAADADCQKQLGPHGRLVNGTCVNLLGAGK